MLVTNCLVHVLGIGACLIYAVNASAESRVSSADDQSSVIVTYKFNAADFVSSGCRCFRFRDPATSQAVVAIPGRWWRTIWICDVEVTSTRNLFRSDYVWISDAVVSVAREWESDRKAFDAVGLEQLRLRIQQVLMDHYSEVHLGRIDIKQGSDFQWYP